MIHAAGLASPEVSSVVVQYEIEQISNQDNAGRQNKYENNSLRKWKNYHDRHNQSFSEESQDLFSLDTKTGPRSAVGNVSGYRCVSDCRSRGREFDPGPVPYFRGD